uniref:Uncharacterized protein n=1 Tax=Laticauda laticaudata TaxID=8630 RepID=A0A8C5S420_LATLA
MSVEILTHPGHGCPKGAFFFRRQLDFLVFFFRRHFTSPPRSFFSSDWMVGKGRIYIPCRQLVVCILPLQCSPPLLPSMTRVFKLGKFKTCGLQLPEFLS